MFAYDDQIELAKTWGDMALSCMSAVAQCTTTMLAPWQQSGTSTPSKADAVPSPRPAQWSEPPTTFPWQRAPEQCPFEPSWLGLSWVLPLAIPGFTPSPQPALGPLTSIQAWTKLLEASSPMMALGLPACFSPAGLTGLLRPLGWPMPASPFSVGLTSAALGPAPVRPASLEPPQFAAYRSDSGHAVAQITFPNNVVAALAVPESAASMIDTFFPWQRMLH